MLGSWMDYSTKKAIWCDIKILDHLKTVIISYHFNALGTAISNWYRHWSHSDLLPCGYQSSSINMDALDVARQVNIFMCTIYSRPGLFVPTLFVMHDVSLTPTKMVA